MATGTAILGGIAGLRTLTRLSAGLLLGLVAAGLAATAQESEPLVAYEDPTAAGRRDRAIGILTWAETVTIIAIDGAAVDPAATQRRARLAPGPHVIYFFATVPPVGDCPPVTGDDLVELKVEEGRSYAITAKGTDPDYNEEFPDVCDLSIEVMSAGVRLAGPGPSLWPAERLARQREAADDRLILEWQRLGRAAADGDPDAAVDLALWYFLGDLPLSSPDPVAAEAWLIATAERGVPRAEALRARIEPTLTGEQRRAAAALAADPPLPAASAEGATP